MSVTGYILKRGHDLRKVLSVLEPKMQSAGMAVEALDMLKKKKPRDVAIPRLSHWA